MKLEVSHNEIVAGLTAFLASQGISGFDPKTCQVTFSQKRGTGELSAVLDTDPAPVVVKEAAPKAEAKPATDKPADLPKDTPAETPADLPADAPAETAAAPAGDAPADAGDDGLFS